MSAGRPTRNCLRTASFASRMNSHSVWPSVMFFRSVESSTSVWKSELRFCISVLRVLVETVKEDGRRGNVGTERVEPWVAERFASGLRASGLEHLDGRGRDDIEFVDVLALLRGRRVVDAQVVSTQQV